jgi:hypothetical protein
MGFFKSSKSSVDVLQDQCDLVMDLAKSVRTSCDRSLRGKYEYMKPEERADLVRAAHEGHQKMHAALEKAKSSQAKIESEGGNNEALLAAESLLLSASLDATEAQKALNEAHSSLVHGVSEVEQFYGPRSKEAKHLRRVLSQFQASA